MGRGGAGGPGPDRLGLRPFRPGWGSGVAGGPGPDRLGFRPFRPGWGGGEKRGNFMYFKCNFSFSRQKKIYIYSSILTFRYASFGDDEIGKCSYR